ncbi:MAG: hypothetical protein N4J56_007650 [Chroococcidiopsis sp. SAG 2025]|nr:hypothetical protein [Chroococcidiopsis sp. SAG 2025]
MQTAPKEEAGPYSDHLRQHWLNLQQYPKQLKELEEVVNKGSVQLEESNSEQVFELNSMGLLKLDNNKATMRCKLYFKYFQERLQINK